MTTEHRSDGRAFVRELQALVDVLDDGRIELRAPAVGLWRGRPAPGSLVRPGCVLGELEVLGELCRLRAPAGASGIVVELADELQAGARRPLAFGQRMAILDPEAAGTVSAEQARAEAAGEVPQGALVFRAPTSGRFYSRPAPEKPPFVEAGHEIAAGQTVCLIEVMKTFSRVVYQPSAADGLPERARIVRVVPRDQDDVSTGDPILELE